MSPGTKLSMEQEFNLRNFSDQVHRMSRQQAQDFLVNLRKQMMVRENLYRSMLKDSWGIGTEA
ncbi:MAG: NblA/ycf18 family protein [Elainellaceae cyanobacterium]